MFNHDWDYQLSMHEPMPVYFDPPTPEPKRDEPKRCRGGGPTKLPRILRTLPGTAIQQAVLRPQNWRRIKAKRKAERAARRVNR